VGFFFFNSFSFQRMGTKDRVGGSTGCIMHRVPTSLLINYVVYMSVRLSIEVPILGFRS
jgi:hypothetical protein